MAALPERTFGQELNIWVQTIGILIAAAWGGYTFIYKEILVPKSAPVNISLSLQLKKIGPGGAERTDKNNQRVAVEMRISATNPSPRQVYLLSSAWVAFGYVDSASDGALFAEDAERALNAHEEHDAQRHERVTQSTVVAVGDLFADKTLKPNETVTTTQVIYVPPGRYDRIEVYTAIPTTKKKGGFDLQWHLDENSIIPTLYRINNNNERTKIEVPEGGYYEPEYELEMAHSKSEVSLWQ